MVNGETDGAAVVESVEDSTVSKASGEVALLKHLTGEGGEDMMESFVEEHNKNRSQRCQMSDRLWLLDRCAVRH